MTAAGYSGTPLPKKLGIKPGFVVGLIDAPPDFEDTLGDDLPSGVTLRRSLRGNRDLTLWFVRSVRDLERRIGRMAREAESGLWIAWPKKSSGWDTDVGESDVRGTGLAAELVDFKICAIDATWSGLRFAVRKDRG